jgi:L-rhamnose mutarotase
MLTPFVVLGMAPVANEGNAIMRRIALVMRVNPDAHAEYQRRHHPIWPEMEAVLKEHGAHNYSIFLNPATHQLFGYVEVEDQARWDAIANTPVCRRWWRSMRALMPCNPDDSPVAVPLEEVFHLE